MKKYIISIIICFLLISSATAAEFKWSSKKDLQIKDVVSYSRVSANAGGAAGVFFGTLAGVYTDTKLLGFGGVQISGVADNTIGLGIAWVPVTAFDDMIQIGIGHRFIDSSTYWTIGVSMQDLIQKTIK